MSDTGKTTKQNSPPASSTERVCRESAKADVTAAIVDFSGNGLPEKQSQWSDLFRKNNEALVSFLTHKLGGDRQEARDVAQEAYSRILGLDNNKTINHLRAYLFKTARNIAVDRLREQSRGPTVHRNEYVLGNVPSDAPSADQIIIGKQQILLLQAAINNLSPKRQYIFLRHRFYNESYADLAMRTGLSESMVRKHVLRAMRYCKTYLDNES